MTRKAFVILTMMGGVLVPASCARAQTSADELVFAGAVVEAGWTTTFTVGNPTDASIQVVLNYDPNPPFCSQLGCNPGVRLVNVPGSGVDTGPDPGAHAGGIGTTYASSDTASLPAVSARITRSDRPEIGVDIPSVRLSRLIAANPTQLDFAGVRQGSAGRSNLVLASIRRVPPPASGSGALAVRIQAFATDGTLVGSLDESLAYGDTLFVGQIIAEMGVAELPNGLLRVTKTGGDGVLWGVLYSVDAGGSIAAVAGAYP